MRSGGETNWKPKKNSSEQNTKKGIKLYKYTDEFKSHTIQKSISIINATAS